MRMGGWVSGVGEGGGGSRERYTGRHECGDVRAWVGMPQLRLTVVLGQGMPGLACCMCRARTHAPTPAQ